jgi:uncharacterized ParB-like nuclease family protein
VDRRRLPGGVRTEKAVDLARLDAKVDPLDRLDVLELADEGPDFYAVFVGDISRLQAQNRTKVR